jgi:aspartate oxidase
LLPDIRHLMDRDVGVVRDREGLGRAIARLLPACTDRSASPRVRDAALVGLMVATSAFDRMESRGAHQRRDHPTAAPAGLHSQITLAEAWGRAAEIAGATTLPAPMRRTA